MYEVAAWSDPVIHFTFFHLHVGFGKDMQCFLFHLLSNLCVYEALTPCLELHCWQRSYINWCLLHLKSSHGSLWKLDDAYVIIDTVLKGNSVKENKCNPYDYCFSFSSSHIDHLWIISELEQQQHRTTLADHRNHCWVVEEWN